MNIEKKNYLFKNVSTLKGVGSKLSKYLKNKNIERINDLLWNLPYQRKRNHYLFVWFHERLLLLQENYHNYIQQIPVNSFILIVNSL